MTKKIVEIGDIWEQNGVEYIITRFSDNNTWAGTNYHPNQMALNDKTPTYYYQWRYIKNINDDKKEVKNSSNENKKVEVGDIWEDSDRKIKVFIARIDRNYGIDNEGNIVLSLNNDGKPTFSNTWKFVKSADIKVKIGEIYKHSTYGIFATVENIKDNNITLNIKGGSIITEELTVGELSKNWSLYQEVIEVNNNSSTIKVRAGQIWQRIETSINLTVLKVRPNIINSNLYFAEVSETKEGYLMNLNTNGYLSNPQLWKFIGYKKCNICYKNKL